jgi:hypothetical protein
MRSLLPKIIAVASAVVLCTAIAGLGEDYLVIKKKLKVGPRASSRKESLWRFGRARPPHLLRSSRRGRAWPHRRWVAPVRGMG